MAKSYVLLYWIETKSTDVIRNLTIPLKYQKEGAITKLKWRNPINGIIEDRFVKILKISLDKNELDNLKVDPFTGTILEDTTTIKNNSELLYEKRKKNATKIVILKKKRKDKKKRKRESSDDDDDDSSTEESSSEDEESESDGNKNRSKELQALLTSVTYENINFLRGLLTLMEKTYERQQKVLASKTSLATKPDPIAISNENMANFHSSLQGFLPPLTLKTIFHRNQDLNDWKKLVTDILVEIYGKQLAFLSAKGRRGAQGIDPVLYRAIYDLINSRLGWILLPKEFVRHINKVCSNRKKYVRSKSKSNLGNSISNPIETTVTENNQLEESTPCTSDIDIKEEPNIFL